MCGIFGHSNFQPDCIHLSRDSLHTLKHRGPDQWGEWYDDYVYLGHRRLSILDLSINGKQPMYDELENVILTINGEIYNYLNLKSELENKYHFNSSSDSEVVLFGYQEWGIKGLLSRVEGMFAFCIYDKSKKKLFLARDRVGIKPLYYSYINSTICWASELKAIQRFYGENNLELDYTALYDFLTYRYIPTPKTMHKNVYKLESGHYLEVDINNNWYKKYQYWNLQVKRKVSSLNTAKEELHNKIYGAVKQQMISDVPVGFFLSGGMDSSAIVATASEFLKSNNILTFSIGFDYKKHDETHFARMIADKYNTQHHEKKLDVKTTSEMFSKIKDWYDEPFGDTSAFPTFLVSEYSKQNVTVVLTGDGGDEVLGGYLWYKKFNKRKKKQITSLGHIKKLINSLATSTNVTFLRRIIKWVEYNFFLEDLEIYTKIMGGMLKSEKIRYAKKWGIPEDYDDYWYFRKYYKKDLPLFTRLQYLDFHTFLPDDILTKVDRVSMAVSLEARVPLLSTELIEYSFGLSEDVRYNNDQLKGLMKDAFKHLLPDEIITRSKKGFDLPMKKWGEELLGGKRTKQEKVLEYFIED